MKKESTGRVIKFRAWDTKAKEWAFHRVFRDQDAWKARGGGIDIFDLTDAVASPKYDNTKHIVVMQFTGLHDKNGKEIYEGDVVNVGPKWSDAQWEVKWDLYGFRLRCVRDFLTGPKNDIVYAAKDQTIDPPLHADLWEVIGDIYSTPELLERPRSITD